MPKIIIGMDQPMIFGIFDFGGIFVKRCKSWSFRISFVMPGTCAAPRTATIFFPGGRLIFSAKYWSLSSIIGFFNLGTLLENSANKDSIISRDLIFSTSSPEILYLLKILTMTCIKRNAFTFHPIDFQMRANVI